MCVVWGYLLAMVLECEIIVVMSLIASLHSYSNQEIEKASIALSCVDTALLEQQSEKTRTYLHVCSVSMSINKLTW